MTETDRRLAVFGSAFDPPHLGHADVVRQLLDRFPQVLLVPSAAHAFGKRMSPFGRRLALLKAHLTEQFPEQPRVRISPIEAELQAAQQEPAPVYSYDLLRALKQAQPDLDPVLILGPDNLRPETWRRFHRYQDIEHEFAIEGVRERLPVHSSTVRAALAEEDCGLARLEPLVGPAVARLLLAERPEAQAAS